MTKTFEVGKTYWARSACDYNTVYEFKVLKRTAKSITIESDTWGKKSRKVHHYDGREMAYPLGQYSMCPIISADKYR